MKKKINLYSMKPSWNTIIFDLNFEKTQVSREERSVSKLSVQGCQNLDLCITANRQIQNWVSKSFVHYSLFLYNPVLRGWHHPTYLHRLRSGMISFLKDSLFIFMYLRFFFQHVIITKLFFIKFLVKNKIATLRMISPHCKTK